MERIAQTHANMEASDSQDTRQSKQRASVKWLLAKAFNNRVPENLSEPFYRDHEDQEHLKPPILGAMANAEMYCLALANMYSDPNYHSLNHWNILQTLARKGVHLVDPPDCALTETVLIQTNPLKMSAHMAVIEAMMTLYAKEVVTWDRVASAAQRFGAPAPPAPAAAVPHEEGLLAWINSACAALNRGEADESSPQLNVPKVQNLQELCDGTALAALISFYCPDALPRNRVRVGQVSSLQDCLHNLMLVYEFCHKFLPHNVFHMLPEDVTYMRGSMRQNLIVMLADLFNMLEIHPVKCVKYPGIAMCVDRNEHGVAHRRCLPAPPPTPIPRLRDQSPHAQHTPFTVPRSPSASHVQGRNRGVMGLQRSACSTPERRSVSPQSHFFNQEESFVVHRGKTVPTLSSVVRQDERANMDPNMTAAGRPSNWEDQRRASGVASGGTYAGRRSRRSSISDDSQLTVENFGGSQDRLNFAGRNPEKELATVNSMRKISAPAGPIEPNVPIRSTKQDAKGSIQFLYSDAPNGPAEERIQKPLERQSSQPQSNEPAGVQYHPIRRQLSSDTITLNQNSAFSNKGGGDGGFYLNNSNRDMTDGDVSLSKLSNFADLNKLRSNGEQSGVQLVYSQQEKDDEDLHVLQQQRKKSTTFATLPNSTTWQQQSMQHEQHPNGDGDQILGHDDGSSSGGVMAAQLNNIRMKLEEKRRRIEQEKKRVELSMNRQRQQVGQQAFLQAVTRSKGASGKSPSDGVSSGDASTGESTPACSRDVDRGKPERPFTLQEISSDVQNVENKWLDHDNSAPFVETRHTPDLDGMGLEEYHQSIAKMNSSLQDIQSDIARLASQQSQLQSNQMYPPQQQHQQPHQQQQLLQQQQQHHQQQQHRQQQLQQQQHQQQQQQQQQVQQQQLFHQQQHHQAQLQQQMYQQAQNQQNIPQLHNQYSSQHNVSSGPVRQYPGLHGTSFGSTPHLPQEHHAYAPPAHHFYLHDNAPQHPQRRTWAQHAQLSNQVMDLGQENRGWQLHQQNSPYQQPHAQPQYQEVPQRSWKSPSPQPVQEMRTWNNPQSFVLHDRSSQQSSPFPVHHSRYQNGTEHSPQNHLSYTVINPAPCHQPSPQTLFSQSPPRTASPQHRVKPPQRQGSYGELTRQPGAVSLQQLTMATHQSPVPAPPADDMEPQNISFIGNAEDEALQQGINRLNISSGTRTYRIPSPTRPSLTRNSFQHPVHEASHLAPDTSDLDRADPSNEKGFYISFDNDQPKRPKPPLRPKRGSPKKEQSPPDYRSPERGSPTDRSDQIWQDRISEPAAEEEFIVHRNVLSNESGIRHDTSTYREPPVARRSEPCSEPAAIIIGNDLSNPDPDSVEEMEKKKERIMMLSLQRRQRADEARARQEQQAAAKKQREMLLQEKRNLKKEEQAKRRDTILQQYKLKKAIEEAEREGKVIDKAELLAAIKPASSISSGTSTIGHSAGARMRSKVGNTGTRTRPKTIHVDSGTVELAEGMLASRGKQGSSTNLTAFGNTPQSTMRRDYYRGSQDSLADRAGLYRDSPIDDSRGMSPGGGSTSALGRRGSYKTSRERVNEVDPQSQTRGRSKYSTYQNNFKTGRKSSSLMNLCDSGLGRATPPRRAPSPGVRALPSPSGPGSLPGGIGKRLRHFDDGASDVSSTPSSIMDYSGPRLYKQPTTKSNRGIMLNAVEYCVFPGAVNREAKRRVLEEIARSESKHFLVLFRDAGCQFRALYSYCPDREEVTKLYGTGPRQVNDRMFDKFFKYNSGSKCFSQVHTKHLTVTIDAFTIHNSLWQGKKVQLPSKKDMALVI